MNNCEKLGGLLMSEMKSTGQHAVGEKNLRFGTIVGNYGLDLDGLSYTVPRRDSLIARACYDYLSVGHRVLVAQVGSNYVVVDVLI